VKRIAVCIFLALLILFSGLTAFADSGRKYEIDIGKEYTVVYKGEDLSDAADLVGMKRADLKKYFDENGVELLAVNADNTSQIKLCAYEDDFSKLAGDISTLDDDGIAQLATSMAGDTSADYGIAESGGRKYIVVSETLKDSGGEYTATQYITVCGGKLYQLSFYTSGTIDKTREIFSSFRINVTGKNDAMPLWQILVIIFGIAVFATVSVICVIGIIRDRKKEDETTED